MPGSTPDLPVVAPHVLLLFGPINPRVSAPVRGDVEAGARTGDADQEALVITSHSSRKSIGVEIPARAAATPDRTDHRGRAPCWLPISSARITMHHAAPRFSSTSSHRDRTASTATLASSPICLRGANCDHSHSMRARTQVPIRETLGKPSVTWSTSAVAGRATYAHQLRQVPLG